MELEPEPKKQRVDKNFNFLNRFAENKDSSEKTFSYWLKFTLERGLAFFLIVLAFIFLTGNNFEFFNLVVLFWVFVIFYSFIIYLTEKNFKKAVIYFGAAIAALFTISQFLITVPMFFADGTDTCNTKLPVTLNNENYLVEISDLKIRHSGERIGFVGIETEIYPKKIDCSGCSITPVPKPDGNNSSIQYTDILLTIESGVKEFSFVQQVTTYGAVGGGILSKRYLPARACECEINLEDSVFECKNSDSLFFERFLSSTWLFRLLK